MAEKRKQPDAEEASIVDYGDRFLRASNRGFRGLDFAREGQWRGDFAFVQLADPQLGMLHWNKSWEEEGAMLKKAVDQINALKPKFVVVCGDLVNAYPDTQLAEQELQFADFKRITSQLDPAIPLVCVCGNHDVGDRPTNATVAQYGKHVGDNYFSFWAGGVRFLALDTQIYRDWALSKARWTRRGNLSARADVPAWLLRA